MVWLTKKIDLAQLNSMSVEEQHWFIDWLRHQWRKAKEHVDRHAYNFVIDSARALANKLSDPHQGHHY